MQAITEKQILEWKEELDKQLIKNYVISNKEILNRNFFFDISNLENTNLALLPAKVVSFDVNKYRCCDKHRMFLLPEVSTLVDSFKVVINKNRLIKISKILLILTSKPLLFF